jgi:hypothetical protein
MQVCQAELFLQNFLFDGLNHSLDASGCVGRSNGGSVHSDLSFFDCFSKVGCVKWSHPKRSSIFPKQKALTTQSH